MKRRRNSKVYYTPTHHHPDCRAQQKERGQVRIVALPHLSRKERASPPRPALSPRQPIPPRTGGANSMSHDPAHCAQWRYALKSQCCATRPISLSQLFTDFKQHGVAPIKKAALIEHRPLVALSPIAPLVRHDLLPALPQRLGYGNWPPLFHVSPNYSSSASNRSRSSL